MKVHFLKDHLQFPDGSPMYEKGEIAHIVDDKALQWILQGIVEKGIDAKQQVLNLSDND